MADHVVDLQEMGRKIRAARHECHLVSGFAHRPSSSCKGAVPSRFQIARSAPELETATRSVDRGGSNDATPRASGARAACSDPFAPCPARRGSASMLSRCRSGADVSPRSPASRRRTSSSVGLGGADWSPRQSAVPPPHGEDWAACAIPWASGWITRQAHARAWSVRKSAARSPSPGSFPQRNFDEIAHVALHVAITELGQASDAEMRQAPRRTGTRAACAPTARARRDPLHTVTKNAHGKPPFESCLSAGTTA